ncbi:nucleotidyltransferase domain-containing protein [Bacillus salacetis]|uniref:nucleotidyltransferase domain-containing protein n=1 Tax=Bacillus salacetis TaxID=2315464 RepID=UPI003BA33070
MDHRIASELKRIESENGIKILYSVQAGSRSWGFPSPKSDYDIRFIYKHHMDWYLSLDKKPDVIEEQAGTDLELSGWDLKKALTLYKKSNSTMLEWLNTRERLVADPLFCEKILPLQAELFSAVACYHHYLSMSKSNWNKWKKDSLKSTKLTLHLLRGVLCCIWIKEHDAFPPVNFKTLSEGTISDQVIAAELNSILDLKKSGEETIGLEVDSLYSFINLAMEKLLEEAPTFSERQKISNEVLNEVFRSLVKSEG